MSTQTRRTILSRGAAIGAAAALAGPAAAVGAGTSSGGASSGAAGGTAPPWEIFANSAWNFEMLLSFGGTAYGVAETGEMFEVVRRVNARTGNPAEPSTADFDVLVAEWLRMAETLEGKAASALARGHRVTARDRFLRASSYYSQALFFVLGTSRPGREQAVFQACERNWLASIALWDPPAVVFTIPVPSLGLQLPAYFFAPDASGARRPTYVICNGSDGQNVDLVYAGLRAALERGYNVLMFEGPGQMSLLFEQQIEFVPDWAPIIDAVIGALRARPDVDPARIAACGISFLGMVLSSAGARSPGLAAMVLEPGSYDLTRIWGDQRSMAGVKEVQDAPAAVQRRVRAEINQGILEAWPHLGSLGRFTIHKRGEIFQRAMLRDARAGRPPSDYFGLLQSMLPFTYPADLAAVRIPTLVTANQNDTLMKGQSRKAYSLLRSVPAESKRLVGLTIAIGGQLHDQPVGPRVAQELIFDWLDDVLGV